MSFFKLSKEERAEWRNLPATRAAIDLLKAEANDLTDKALNALTNGSQNEAASSAGAARYLKFMINRLEND